MHIIWTILIGFVAGLVAKIITPGSGPGGFFLTAALGIGGSLAATYVGQAMGWYQPGETAGFIGAVLGAAVLLILYHLSRAGPRSESPEAVMGWMDMLNQVAGAAGDPERQFDQVAQQAPPDVLGKSVTDAFLAKETPPMEKMVGELFGRSDPSQQAGVLNQLLASLGPALMTGAAGGVLSKILTPGANQVTPEQASQLDPADVQQIVNHARQINPGIADELGQFYANHSTLIKTLGGAVLAIALAKMKDHAAQR